MWACIGSLRIGRDADRGCGFQGFFQSGALISRGTANVSEVGVDRPGAEATLIQSVI
jgi:hypothetical protein